MKIAQETITPETAREYLKFNTNNYRSINKFRVMSYASDMKNGKWQLNGEAIKFDETGKLIDGQHRLQAIVIANVPVEMLVIRGVEEGVNLYDIGSTRSMGQIAKARGVVGSGYTQVLAVANWMVANSNHHSGIGKAVVMQYAEDHTEDLERSVRYVSIGTKNPVCRKSAVAAAAYCLIRDGVAQDEIGDFFRIANTGLPHGHYDPSPALVYRNMVMENTSNSEEERRLLFSAAISAVRDFTARKSRQVKYKFDMKSYELLYKVRKMDGVAAERRGEAG